MTVLLRRLAILLLPETYFLMIEATGVREGFQGPKPFHVQIYWGGRGVDALAPVPLPTWWYLQQQAHCPARWRCPTSSDPLEGVGASSVPKGTGQTCIGAAVKYRRLLSRASSTSRLWTTTPALHIPGSGTVHQGPQGASGGPHSLRVRYGTLCFLPVPVCKLPHVSCTSSPHPSKPPHPGLGSGFASWRSKLRRQETKNSESQLMKLKRDAHFMQVRLLLYFLIYVCVYIYVCVCECVCVCIYIYI